MSNATYAIFTTDGFDQYGRPAMHTLVYVGDAESPEDAWGDFVEYAGIDTDRWSMSDHAFWEVPAEFMDISDDEVYERFEEEGTRVQTEAA